MHVCYGLVAMTKHLSSGHLVAVIKHNRESISLTEQIEVSLSTKQTLNEIFDVRPGFSDFDHVVSIVLPLLLQILVVAVCLRRIALV